MIGFAYERVKHQQTMPGLFVLPNRCPIGAAIEELHLRAIYSDPPEYDSQVLYLLTP